MIRITITDEQGSPLDEVSLTVADFKTAQKDPKAAQSLLAGLELGWMDDDFTDGGE